MTKKDAQSKNVDYLRNADKDTLQQTAHAITQVLRGWELKVNTGTELLNAREAIWRELEARKEG